MRWERLFADLEAQLAAAEDADFSSEVADRSRRELALVQLADRMRASTGRTQVRLDGGESLYGVVAGSGADWVLLADDGAETLVPLAAVAWVRDLPMQSDGPGSPVTGRLGLGHALRALARDRAETTVLLRTAERLTGTLDRVGADFVDLAEHPLGEPRRAGAVTSTRTIPFSALAALRRQ
jgi:hypothetical protein